MEKDESLGGFLRFFRHMTSDDVVKNEAASLLRQAYIEPGQKRKDREMQCSAWDMFQGQEEDPSKYKRPQNRKQQKRPRDQTTAKRSLRLRICGNENCVFQPVKNWKSRRNEIWIY